MPRLLVCLFCMPRRAESADDPEDWWDAYRDDCDFGGFDAWRAHDVDDDDDVWGHSEVEPGGARGL